ncbi:unnamed protein product [Calypogeia fissa]
MATKETQDIEWYVKNRGLATGGVDVTALTSGDISVEQIEDLFGPKVSKNGYRYDRKPEPEIVGKILELYKRVTGKTTVLNNQINLAFARGVVAWINGAKLDWAKYAVHCSKYAENLKQTKASNLGLKVQTMGQVEKIPLQRRASRPPTQNKLSLLSWEIRKSKCEQWCHQSPIKYKNLNGRKGKSWRTTVTEVTSPLKGLRPARGVMPNSVAKVWPSANMKLNLSAAFNEDVVPQIEALQTKKIGDPKPTPVQMEFPSEKENTLDDYSSDDEEFFQPGLVHYPPQPILGTGGLQHFDSITSIEDSQSESEDVLHGSNNENHSRAVGVVDPKSPPKQIKRRNNPLDPNPGCQKCVTRAELLEVALSVAAKKVQKKKRKKVVPVKYFNSFS